MCDSAKYLRKVEWVTSGLRPAVLLDYAAVDDVNSLQHLVRKGPCVSNDIFFVEVSCASDDCQSVEEESARSVYLVVSLQSLTARAAHVSKYCKFIAIDAHLDQPMLIEDAENSKHWIHLLEHLISTLQEHSNRNDQIIPIRAVERYSDLVPLLGLCLEYPCIYCFIKDSTTKKREYSTKKRNKRKTPQNTTEPQKLNGGLAHCLDMEELLLVTIRTESSTKKAPQRNDCQIRSDWLQQRDETSILQSFSVPKCIQRIDGMSMMQYLQTWFESRKDLAVQKNTQLFMEIDTVRVPHVML